MWEGEAGASREPPRRRQGALGRPPAVFLAGVMGSRAGGLKE